MTCGPEASDFWHGFFLLVPPTCWSNLLLMTGRQKERLKWGYAERQSGEVNGIILITFLWVNKKKNVALHRCGPESSVHDSSLPLPDLVSTLWLNEEHKWIFKKFLFWALVKNRVTQWTCIYDETKSWRRRRQWRNNVATMSRMIF